jgi:hypothetical protein
MSLVSCPIKSSKEYQDILAQANNNEEEALRLWNENEKLRDNPDLNEFTEEEPVEEESSPFKELIDKVILFLTKQLSDLKRKKLVDQTAKEKGLAELIANIKAAEGVQSINIFIDDAIKLSRQAHSRFKTIIANKENLTTHQMIEQLTSVNDFIKGYSVINEIDKVDMSVFSEDDTLITGIELSKMNPKSKLKEIKLIRDEINKEYVEKGIPLLAEFLSEFSPESLKDQSTNLIETAQKRIQEIEASSRTEEQKAKEIEPLQDRIDNILRSRGDKESLIKSLKEAYKDEGVLDYLLAPIISSPDSVIALFGKSMKRSFQLANLKNIEFEKIIAPKFEEFAKAQGSKQNVKEFNKPLFEEVDYVIKDKKGEDVVIKRAAFVQKFDMNKYNKAQSELYKSLGEKPTDAKSLKEWKKRRNNWYRTNTQTVSKERIAEIDKAKKKELTDKIITADEYETWKTEERVKEVTEPSNQYLNDRWLAMYNINGEPKTTQGRHHKFLLDTYLEDQKKLPVSQRPGYFIPSIEKTDADRLTSNSLKEFAKDKITDQFQLKSYDAALGISNLSSEDARIIPVYYNQVMDANDVSLDLTRSIMMFHAMTNNYQAVNNYHGEISLMKAVIGNRKVAKTNSKGKAIMDSVAEKLGITEFIAKNGESYSEKHLNDFIDMIAYGQMQKAEEIFGISATKLTNSIMGFSAITTISMDVLKGTANSIQANIQVLIEANSGEFFGKKNLAKGKAKFWSKAAPAMVSDWGKPTPTSLYGQLHQLYDPMQGRYKDQYGRNVTATIANKLIRSDTLFFNQHFGELEIATTTLYALMDNTMVKTNDGREITLLAAYEEFGVNDVFDKTDFTLNKQLDLQDRIHALNKRMHGVYNEQDKGTAQRFSLARLLLMYRKHVVPGYTRRFKKLGADQELGAYTEGYYRVFYDTVLKDLTKFKFNIVKNWSTYDPFEQANIKRVIAEMTIIASTALIIMIMEAAGDDDEELKTNFTYNFLLYEAIRMRSETSSYIWLPDAYRIVKSPSAITGTLDRTIKFMSQIMPWNITEEYERKTGIWEAGDNKAWAYFLRLMGYSGYNLTPEEAINSFKSTLVK